MERQAGNVRCPVLCGANKQGNLAGQLHRKSALDRAAKVLSTAVFMVIGLRPPALQDNLPGVCGDNSAREIGKKSEGSGYRVEGAGL